MYSSLRKRLSWSRKEGAGNSAVGFTVFGPVDVFCTSVMYPRHATGKSPNTHFSGLTIMPNSCSRYKNWVNWDMWSSVPKLAMRMPSSLANANVDPGWMLFMHCWSVCDAFWSVKGLRMNFKSSQWRDYLGFKLVSRMNQYWLVRRY